MIKGVNGRGELAFSQGEHKDAAKYYGQAIQMMREARVPNHALQVSVNVNCAELATEQANMEAAEAHLRKALKVSRHNEGVFHPQTLSVLRSYAKLLMDRAKFHEVEKQYSTFLQVISSWEREHLLLNV